MRRTAAVLLVTLLAAFASAQVADDAAIRKLLGEKKDVGVVVGVIEPGGRRVIGHGALDQKDRRAPGGDTVFEIGSATKVFTAMLLADMVAKGEVALDDPVVKYLPSEVKLSKAITLRHLATHTSGLPRIPSNLLPQNPSNPYADYTVEQMYDFLSGIQLTRDPGAAYEYSNLGAGLLGHVLARRAGTDYETLVRRRILEPLGMKNTSIKLSKDMQRRLAPGHDEALVRTANWDFPTLAGAGALRSTANDMLTFLAAAIEGKTPVAAMLAERRPTISPDTEIALGWHITKRNGREIVWHNGGTGGYRSFIGYDPKAKTGVVILSNTATEEGVDAVGYQLLNPAAADRKTVTVDAKTFDRFVGHYELAPSFVLQFTREGDRFFTQATGQPKIEIFPESETKYFLKVVDAQLTFESDAEGNVTGVVLHQNGMDQRAKRLAQAPAAKEPPKQVAVDTKIYDKYLGRYQLTPAFILDVTREGDHLYVQATAQPKFEVFPMSETKFFYKVVDAQITFTEEGLILHQNGQDVAAKRLAH